MQIKRAIDTPFVPRVQENDPDLTIYENVNNILMNEGPVSQGKKKPELSLRQPEGTQNVLDDDDNDAQERLLIDQAVEDQLCINEEVEILNPDDVSRTLSELAASANGPNELNCSAIGGNEEVHVPTQGSSKISRALSSTPGNKKLKKRKAVGPEEVTDVLVQKAELEASKAIIRAADKIADAADKIVNCVIELRSDIRTEFKPAVTALGNRNYREMQMTTNAVKQLVIFWLKFFNVIYQIVMLLTFCRLPRLQSSVCCFQWPRDSRRKKTPLCQYQRDLLSAEI